MERKMYSQNRPIIPRARLAVADRGGVRKIAERYRKKADIIPVTSTGTISVWMK